MAGIYSSAQYPSNRGEELQQVHPTPFLRLLLLCRSSPSNSALEIGKPICIPARWPATSHRPNRTQTEKAALAGVA
jgi:hypothetical protein